MSAYSSYEVEWNGIEKTFDWISLQATILFSARNYLKANPMSQPNDRDNPQKKLLDGLQKKKQLILKSGAAQPIYSSAVSQPMGWSSGTDGQLAGNSQRQSFAQLTSHSFGFFIAQESSFGNHILPVLPRV